MFPKKVLLLGGNGPMAIKLMQFLQKKNCDIVPTVRSNTSMIQQILINKFNGCVCNSDEDYNLILNKFQPDYVINTIPQPSNELLKSILNQKNCFKINFSSPASDFAKTYPEKCPNGSYQMDKLEMEKLVNSHSKINKDAIVFQIGFISELVILDCIKDDKSQTSTFSYAEPICSGLSFDTMLKCNLVKFDKIQIPDFDLSKGFTCTPIDNICKLVGDIITNNVTIPDFAFGRTLAMHSSQIFSRKQIKNILENPNHLNDVPEFYGQKQLNDITKPVTEFLSIFDSYKVTHQDVSNAIILSGRLFDNPLYHLKFINHNNPSKI